jgi:YVTN family beta-propeller protein
MTWGRGRLLAVGLVALGSTASGETLVVLNKSDATASLIDLRTGAVAVTLPTGQGPHEAATAPDGRRVLVTNYGGPGAPGSSLTLLDVAAGRVVKTIELGEYRRPHGVAWIDDRRAAVTAEANQALLVVDVEAGKVESAIVTGQEISHMVVVTPDKARAFVANIGSGGITAIDLKAGKVLAHIPTGAGAEGIDLTPDGKQVWVTNREADTVSVVDAVGLKVVKTLPSQAFPIRARSTPDGARVLVSHARSSEVVVYDAAGARELARIPVKIPLPPGPKEGRLLAGFGDSAVPIGIVVAPDGKKAFVAAANADAIVVLDLAARVVTGTLKAGREPDGMAYVPVVTRAQGGS